MGLILQKTFDGQHRWIPDGEGGKLDAMFFSSTIEVPVDDDENLDYKNKPTFILCNPNAMFYQHMVN